MTTLEKNLKAREILFSAVTTAENINFRNLYFEKIKELQTKALNMTLHEAEQKCVKK